MPNEKISHCPSCHKPIITEGVFGAGTNFIMRCPWCQVNIKIITQTQIFLTAMHTHAVRELEELYGMVKPVGNGDM